MPSERSHSPKLPFTQEPPSSHLRPCPPSPSTPTKSESVIDKQHLSPGGLPSISLGLDQEDRRAHNGGRLAQPNPPSTPVIDSTTSKRFTHILPPTPPESPADARSRARGDGDIDPGKDTSSSPLSIRTTTPEPANSAPSSLAEHFDDNSDDSSQGGFEEVRSGHLTTHKVIERFFRPLANILALPKRRPRAREAREVRKARKSRVDDAFRLVKKFSNGQYIGPQPRSRTLSQAEYRDLLDRIEAETEVNEYFCKGLRFNYLAAEKWFTIHMVTRLHETFGSNLNNEIYTRVKGLALQNDDPIITRIIAGIYSGGSPQLRPRHGQYEGLRPDASFSFARGAPELVIEVGWTQPKSDVETKTRQYFGDFKDQVRTIIGVNLNDIYKEQEVARKKWLYNKMKYEKGKVHSEPEPLEFLVPEAAAKSADFSVWRADKRAVKNRLFQTSYGKYKAGAKLQLYLNDFIRPADIERICEQEGRRVQDIKWPKVEISSEILCEMVKIAVYSYHDTYLEDANRAWEKDKAKWIKKEADAEAARRRQAAESEAAGRRSSVPGTFGRLRNRAKLLKPYWLRSPKL